MAEKEILPKNEKEGVASQSLNALSDEEVFALSLKNPALFEIIVNRYKTAFLRKVGHIIAPIGGIDGAEDVVQEAFVKIFTKSRLFTSKGKGSFRSWAYTILMNTCFSAYRKSKRNKTISMDENLEVYATIPDMNLSAEEDRKLSLDFMISLFSRLPETLRRTANMYFIKGKNHEEIAESEHTSEGTIRTRIHRARLAIKKINDEISNKVGI
ncbi:MAG TPA: RNA polymerase sigma factor [Candidatus Paceibacterota bacterium]